MRSASVVLLLAVQLVCADTNFNLNITNNLIYTDTYVSPHHGHIGAGLSLGLIDAAPDPRFYFQPFTSNDSAATHGMLKYNGSIGSLNVGFSPAHLTTSNVWLMWIGGGNTANFTFGVMDGTLKLLGGDPNGSWMACNVTDSNYGNFTAVNWFNGTGTPDNKECVDIGIVRG